MRKILCILVMILLLAGCEKEKTKEYEIPDFRGFKTDVYTVINDTKITGSAEFTELQGLVLTLTSPESLKGMEIICKDGECKTNLHTLSFSVLYENLPPNSLPTSLMACAESAKTAIYENGYYKFSVNGHTYQLYIDENGFTKLSTDGNDILHFENFKYNMGQT
ncbi:MAG: hypothetical protein IKC45_08975 [Clostridia bacterium]|nr:hypothetical protein [Clostridia bacterium]